MHVEGDFNLSNFVRTSTFFGYDPVFYVGDMHESSAELNKYEQVTFLKTDEEFVAVAREHDYITIAIENNTDYKAENVYDFIDGINIKKFGTPIFVFGEEERGLSDYILYNSDHILYIPSNTNNNSLNVNSASSIVLSYYARLFQN